MPDHLPLITIINKTAGYRYSVCSVFLIHVLHEAEIPVFCIQILLKNATEIRRETSLCLTKAYTQNKWSLLIGKKKFILGSALSAHYRR